MWIGYGDLLPFRMLSRYSGLDASTLPSGLVLASPLPVISRLMIWETFNWWHLRLAAIPISSIGFLLTEIIPFRPGILGVWRPTSIGLIVQHRALVPPKTRITNIAQHVQKTLDLWSSIVLVLSHSFRLWCTLNITTLYHIRSWCSVVNDYHWKSHAQRRQSSFGDKYVLVPNIEAEWTFHSSLPLVSNSPTFCGSVLLPFHRSTWRAKSCRQDDRGMITVENHSQ